jgi:hypothetical protein
MKIDRAKFLMLASVIGTGTLAGCSSSATTSSTSDGGAATADSGTGSTADSGGSSTTEGGDAGTCTNESTAPVNCTEAAAGTAACGAVFDRLCGAYVTDFKSDLSIVAANCLLATTNCSEGIGLAGVPSCVAEALGAACPDPTAESFCNDLVTACTEGGVARLSLSDCLSVAPVLSTAGRAALTSCINEGTVGACGANPTDCITAY